MNVKKELRLQTLLVSLIVSLMTIVLLGIVQNFTHVQNSLGKELLKINEEVTQTANAVTSVVTYFRGLDTLGEVTILFLAIFGISLTLEKNIAKENILKYDNTLLQIATKVLTPLIVLFGLYIIFHGHLSPGGGFQGGVIIASAFLLQFLAYGDSVSINHKVLKIIESLSGAGFVILGILGFFVGGLFLGNIFPLGTIGAVASGGIIPILYIVVGMKVAAEMVALIEYFIKANDARES